MIRLLNPIIFLSVDNPRAKLAGRKRPRTRSQSAAAASRSHSRPGSKLPRDQSGVRDAEQLNTARKKMKLAQRDFIKYRRAGESDRTIVTKMPKHLFSGKRGKGKTQRR